MYRYTQPQFVAAPSTSVPVMYHGSLHHHQSPVSQIALGQQTEIYDYNDSGHYAYLQSQYLELERWDAFINNGAYMTPTRYPTHYEAEVLALALDRLRIAHDTYAAYNATGPSTGYPTHLPQTRVHSDDSDGFSSSSESIPSSSVQTEDYCYAGSVATSRAEVTPPIDDGWQPYPMEQTNDSSLVQEGTVAINNKLDLRTGSNAGSSSSKAVEHEAQQFHVSPSLPVLTVSTGRGKKGKAQKLTKAAPVRKTKKGKRVANDVLQMPDGWDTALPDWILPASSVSQERSAMLHRYCNHTPSDEMVQLYQQENEDEDEDVPEIQDKKKLRYTPYGVSGKPTVPKPGKGQASRWKALRQSAWEDGRPKVIAWSLDGYEVENRDY